MECLKIITRSNSLRIAEYAFQLAREKGRRRVTAVHKANIMWVTSTPNSPTLHYYYFFIYFWNIHWFVHHHRKLGDGLFLQCCREVASGYPDITFDSMIVDNTTMQVEILMSLDLVWEFSKKVYIYIYFFSYCDFLCISSLCPNPNSLTWWWCLICMGTLSATCAPAWWEGLALCLALIMVGTMPCLKR